jgi:hypothetical protein
VLSTFLDATRDDDAGGGLGANRRRTMRRNDFYNKGEKKS